jgi:hypothetical protein
VSNNMEIQYVLTANTELAYSELRKLETVLIRITNYIERLTGSPELRKLLNFIQATITAVRSLQMALRALEVASGPIGWAYAATSVAATGFSGYNIYESIVGV